jgi:hypothetical protein
VRSFRRRVGRLVCPRVGRQSGLLAARCPLWASSSRCDVVGIGRRQRPRHPAILPLVRWRIAWHPMFYSVPDTDFRAGEAKLREALASTLSHRPYLKHLSRPDERSRRRGQPLCTHNELCTTDAA